VGAVVEASADRSQWTFAQKGLLVVSLGLLAWSALGLIVNPDFSTGPNAPTKQVLGVDFNGWHAVSGFLLLAPAFYFVRRPQWALLFTLYVGGILFLTAIWAAFDTNPAGILAFPNNEADAALHMGFALLFLAVAAVQIRRDRRQAAPA
jgi:hypothetical protein